MAAAVNDANGSRFYVEGTAIFIILLILDDSKKFTGLFS
jgi:hypothetical protein